METRGALEVSTNVPARNVEIQERLRSYQNVRHASFSGFDNEGIYMETRFADTAQVHHVAKPLYYRQQVTFTQEPIKGCVVNPNNMVPPGFLYGQDKGGDEQIQFYLYNAENGKHTLLTDGKSFHYSIQWCKQTGQRIAYTSNSRDGVHFDLYVLQQSRENESKEETASNNDWRLSPLEQGKIRGMDRSLIYNMDESPGYTNIRYFYGNEMLVSQYVSVTDSKLFLLRVPNASDWGRVDPQVIHIAPTTEKASVQNGVWTRNRTWFCSDETTRFRTLRYYDKNTKETVQAEPGIEWDVENIAVSTQGDVVVVYNMDGKSTFYHGADPPKQPLQKLDWDSCFVGVVSGKVEFCPNTRRLGFSISAANGPSDVWVADFDSDPNPQMIMPVAWTRSETGGLNRDVFVKPHLIHYKSFDGLELPAFVYCPRDAVIGDDESDPKHDDKRRKVLSSRGVPVVVHPHGGPEGQHRPRFIPFYQYLVCELGICVIDPNVRGSSGYGKEFVSLDNCEKRQDSVKDIGALLDWIDTQTDNKQESATSPGTVRFRFNKEKIAVWGGSYGGYMCLASLISYKNRFACGVDMVGISNFVTFLENTSSYRRDLRRLKYGDERDPTMRQLLHDISPLTNAQEIVAPLFVVQGANDPRVPLSEARQIYNLAKENGQEAWWMLAQNEGHGFRKKANLDAYQEAMVQFFKKFLMG